MLVVGVLLQLSLPSWEQTYIPSQGTFKDDFPLPKVGYGYVSWRVDHRQSQDSRNWWRNYKRTWCGSPAGARPFLREIDENKRTTSFLLELTGDTTIDLDCGRWWWNVFWFFWKYIKRYNHPGIFRVRNWSTPKQENDPTNSKEFPHSSHVYLRKLGKMIQFHENFLFETGCFNHQLYSLLNSSCFPFPVPIFFSFGLPST